MLCGEERYAHRPVACIAHYVFKTGSFDQSNGPSGNLSNGWTTTSCSRMALSVCIPWRHIMDLRHMHSSTHIKFGTTCR